MNLKDPIVIIGFKASGKSLIGSLLAKKLGLEFTDTDSLIESLYLKREGEKLSFREIFKKHGEKYFRELEKEVLVAVSTRGGGVISLGGGSLAEVISGADDFINATFVYLSVEKDVLFKRILKNGIPAFFDKEAPQAYFEKLFAIREPVYKKFANITIDNTNKKPEEVAHDIMLALG